MRGEPWQTEEYGAPRPYSRAMKVAAAVMVALAVCAAVTPAVWFILTSRFSTCADMCSPTVEFDVKIKGGNWSMVVTDVPMDLLLNETYLTIYDESGSKVGTMSEVALSELTPSNWSLHYGVYRKVGNEIAIAVGAEILLDVATYPPIHTYELLDAISIVAKGTLQEGAP